MCCCVCGYHGILCFPFMYLSFFIALSLSGYNYLSTGYHGSDNICRIASSRCSANEYSLARNLWRKYVWGKDRQVQFSFIYISINSCLATEFTLPKYRYVLYEANGICLSAFPFPFLFYFIIYQHNFKKNLRSLVRDFPTFQTDLV